MLFGTYPSNASPTRPQPTRAHRALVVVSVVTLAVLAGCASRSTRAPVTDMSTAPASTAPATGTYVVKPGDTLYKIAQMHGMDVATLSRLNNIVDPSQLAVGRTLRLSGDVPAPAAPARPSPGTATPSPVSPATPVEPVAPVTPPRAGDANLISWAWPAQGKIIQTFNSNTKGIDIEGNEGDPILAAAPGKVMYAGNGVRGLGNLVLVGHSNGFITAYAHNQSLLVKTGQEVKKGEKIATLGQTDTSSPRLHFEIRRGGTPVNPLSYLPAR